MNQYFDSFGDNPLPEEVISLQNLGEVAAELEVEIDKLRVEEWLSKIKQT